LKVLGEHVDALGESAICTSDEPVSPLARWYSETMRARDSVVTAIGINLLDCFSTKLISRLSLTF
jgi:hypothetical protein